MIKSDKKLLRELKTNSDKVIKIELYYDIGGPTIFTGGHNERGYYLGVQPIVKTANYRTYAAFSGTKALIEPTKRFSLKRLNEIEVSEDIIQRVLNNVLEKNHLTIKEG